MPADRTPADRRAAEIIQTWLDGATPDAAGALTHDPELAADKAIALHLAFAEILIREHKGERLDVEEHCARFAAYHASLGRMLAQQHVGPGAGGRRAVTGDTRRSEQAGPGHARDLGRGLSAPAPGADLDTNSDAHPHRVGVIAVAPVRASSVAGAGRQGRRLQPAPAAGQGGLRPSIPGPRRADHAARGSQSLQAEV